MARIFDGMAVRANPARCFAVEFSRWPGQGGCGDRAGRQRWSGEHLRQQYLACNNRHQRILRLGDECQRSGLLSDACMPYCGYSSQHGATGWALAHGRKEPNLSDPIERVRDFGKRAGLLVELHRYTQSQFGVPQRVAHRNGPTDSLDSERPNGHRDGQRSHRTGGHKWLDRRIWQQRYGPPDRHQWLLCCCGTRRSVPEQSCALPSTRHPTASGVATDRRNQ